MQIKGLHKSIYRASHMALSMEINDEIAKFRYQLIRNWDILRNKKLATKEIEQITGLSRATYYRRKKDLRVYGIQGLKIKSRRPKHVRTSSVDQKWIQLILKIRREHPTYGKGKITIILKRDYGFTYAESTVGRILSKLMQEGKIKKYRPSQKSRRGRKFDKHALRWTGLQKPQEPGDMVQIDHMSVNKNGMNVKHFQAWDPLTKTIVAEVYSCATSRSAAHFLDKVRQHLGFELKSIQVDGGSEFMKHFEEKCKTWKIPLYVLPPKSPKLNGGVERSNRTFREDFYESESFVPGNLEEVREQLEEALFTYNSFRPHMSLGGLTPQEYAKRILSEANSVSHVMN